MDAKKVVLHILKQAILVFTTKKLNRADQFFISGPPITSSSIIRVKKEQLQMSFSNEPCAQRLINGRVYEITINYQDFDPN